MDRTPAAAPHTRRRATVRERIRRLDGIDAFALILLTAGVVVMAWGTLLDPPAGLNDAVLRHFGNWAPGLLTDGLLLLVVNAILRSHERTRVLSQAGSMSREFAMDAVRRARDEGWLLDGSMAGRALQRANLAGADLSGASLAGVDLSFSDLRGAMLAHADLSGADLTGAHLVEADLRWTDLRGATMQWADLRGAMLDGARCDGVDARFAAVDAREGILDALPGAIIGGFLDESQIAEIRRTFERVAAHGAGPIEYFYERLFRKAPEARHMFRADPAAQARKLLQSLKVIVSGLHAPHRHVAVLRRLGERHEGYGVRPEHYAIVGETLLEVLAEFLGAEFTTAARAAWGRAFQLMATIMTGGASGREARVGHDERPVAPRPRVLAEPVRV